VTRRFATVPLAGEVSEANRTPLSREGPGILAAEGATPRFPARKRMNPSPLQPTMRKRLPRGGLRRRCRATARCRKGRTT